MPDLPPSLTTLAQAWVSQRDEGAARALMHAMHPLVAGIAKRHLYFSHSVEDVVQETWIRVFHHLHRWVPTHPLEAWVSRIAVNTCLKHLRTRRRKPMALWEDLNEGQREAALAVQEGASALTMPSNGARELLQILLDTLSAKDRQIITLIHLEERSLEEASALTGTPKPLLKMRAWRARAKLKAALEKLEHCE